MNSKVINFFKWSRAIVRYNGWVIFCWRILQQSLLAMGRLELVTFFEKDLSQSLNDMPLRTDLSVRLAALPDIPTLVRLMHERQKIKGDLKKIEFEKLVLSRFWGGSLCFLGEIGKEIVHYNWVAFKKTETLGGRLVHLNPDEAFCLDAFTLKERRGLGIYPIAHLHMLRVLQEKGIRKAYTLIDTDNISSKKPHFRQGWKPMGTVLCFTRKGETQSRIWRIKGNLGRFLEITKPAAVNS